MTKAERWKVVEELFHRALDVPDGERTAFIDANSDDAEIAREVFSLIESDSAAATGSVAAAAVKKALVSFHQVETATATAPGRRVGHYQLIKEIGRGGMGTVYLATRADDTFDKKVAVKIVRRGMDTDFILARFRRERQILAQLEHPNIARLIDGGASDDGLPYLVMEYVQGVSISEYVQQNDLSVEQRLKLFLQICDAVDYAHRNFVIHRDLKPGNVLVDERGTPKLLDFGISKLLVVDANIAATETITRDVRMLTPDYASPEQVLGESVTAAADIYSLGGVLFELLTSVKPHRIERNSPQAVERAICEQDIAKPSEAAREAGKEAVARKLQGDLDNILLLAMRKEPKRRYASAHEFAEDIRRYLNHMPVSARPDTISYRTKKFLRRNWGPLIAVLAVVSVLLFGVLLAQREARIAQTHFNQVRRLANTFVTGVHDEIRNLPGSTRARRMIVQTGLEYLEALASNSQGDLDLQREVGAGYLRIGDVQGNVLESNLGDTAGALASYEKALKLLENVSQKRPDALDVQSDILTIYRRTGDIYGYTKSTDAALRAYAHARAVGETLLARKPEDDTLRRSLAGVYQAQGRTLRLAEDQKGAIEACSRALDLYRDLIQKHPDDTSLRHELGSTVSAAGMALQRVGRRDEALNNFHEGVRQYELLVAQDPQNTNSKRGLMLAYSHVGDAYSEPGIAKPSELPNALLAYVHMYEVAQQLYRADPADARAVFDLGVATMRVANGTVQQAPKFQKYNEALGYLKKAAEINGDLMVQMNVAYVQTQMGDLLRERGSMAEAARYYRDAIPIGEKLMAADPKNSSVRRTLINGLRRLGEDAARRHSTREAVEMRDKLVRLSDEIDKPGQSFRVQALVPKGWASIGFINQLLADKEGAREAFEKSLTGYRRLQSEPAFAARKEMQEVESALASLR